MATPKILIYRDRLLPISETFVRDHHDSLIGVEAAMGGLRRVNGVDISHIRLIVMERERRDPLGISAFKLFGHAPRFMSEIEAFEPDVIHAHFAVDAVDMLPVARRLKVPLIVTLHGYDVTYTDKALRAMGPVGWNFLAKRRALQDEAALFLPVSDYIRERAIAQNYPEDRTQVHYLGIDAARFGENRRPSHPPAMLFVGRLVEKKGLSYLIKAASILSQENEPFELRIIGDGPLRRECEDEARRLGANATFLGAQSHDVVIDEMSKATLFSMPSIRSTSGDNEGLPITLLEAQASGLPVVAFAQGPIFEAVANGITGLLAEEKDVSALARALSRLLRDKSLRLTMGSAGIDRIRSEFDIEKRSFALAELYRRLANTPRDAKT